MRKYLVWSLILGVVLLGGCIEYTVPIGESLSLKEVLLDHEKYNGEIVSVEGEVNYRMVNITEINCDNIRCQKVHHFRRSMLERIGGDSMNSSWFWLALYKSAAFKMPSDDGIFYWNDSQSPSPIPMGHYVMEGEFIYLGYINDSWGEAFEGRLNVIEWKKLSGGAEDVWSDMEMTGGGD